MLDILAQVGIMIFGCSAIWFVGRREVWRRWGYILGMCGQPFWVYTTIHHEQWGIAALTLLYTYSWGQGIWNFWLRPAAAPAAPPPACARGPEPSRLGNNPARPR